MDDMKKEDPLNTSIIGISFSSGPIFIRSTIQLNVLRLVHNCPLSNTDHIVVYKLSLNSEKVRFNVERCKNFTDFWN